MSIAVKALTPQQVIRKQKSGEAVHPGEQEQIHRHLISVLVENSIGALNRVANMFSQRGFNLESVAIGETDDASVSRMTLVTTGNDRIIAQVLRQLGNLIDTLKIDDLTHEEYVERELCLIKVRYNSENRAEIMETVNVFQGKVVDITLETMTFELTGPAKKINAFVGLMRHHGIVEIARSGRVAMRRALVFGD